MIFNVEVDRNVVDDLPGKAVLAVVLVLDRLPVRTDLRQAAVTVVGALFRELKPGGGAGHARRPVPPGVVTVEGRKPLLVLLREPPEIVVPELRFPPALRLFHEFPPAVVAEGLDLPPAVVDLRDPVELVVFVADRTVKPFLLLRVEARKQTVVVNTGTPFLSRSSSLSKTKPPAQPIYGNVQLFQVQECNYTIIVLLHHSIHNQNNYFTNIREVKNYWELSL